MDETSFSYKTLRNASYLFMGFLVPLAFGIFVTRELAIKLGAAEFGIFVLVNAISAFVGFVDLGLTTAITKYTAEYHAKGNMVGLRNLLSSSKVLFVITGSLGLIIFLAIGKWLLPYFHISVQSASHIFWVFAFAGLVFFFNSLNSVYNAILNALQRFDLITKLNLINLVAVSLGTIILLNMGYRLKAIMALNAFAGFIYVLAAVYYAKRELPELHLGFFVDKHEIKKAYKFGLLTFVSNLAASALIYFDRLFIPIFLGPAQLAFYSVPGNVALKTTSVTNSLGGMFMPMASAFEGSGEIGRLKIVYIRAFRNLSVVTAAITVAIVLFADKILYFWLGAEYAAKGTEVLVVLALTNYLVALYVPLQGMLLGLGKMKFLIRQSILMAILNIALLIFLVPIFGILGAAWAYLISVLPMIYAFHWTEKRVFGIVAGQSRLYVWLYAKLTITAMVDGAIIYYLLVSLATNIWKLAIIGPLSVLLYISLYYLFGFLEKEDVQLIKSFLQKFFRLRGKEVSVLK